MDELFNIHKDGTQTIEVPDLRAEAIQKVAKIYAHRDEKVLVRILRDIVEMNTKSREYVSQAYREIYGDDQLLGSDLTGLRRIADAFDRMSG